MQLLFQKVSDEFLKQTSGCKRRALLFAYSQPLSTGFAGSTRVTLGDPRVLGKWPLRRHSPAYSPPSTWQRLWQLRCALPELLFRLALYWCCSRVALMNSLDYKVSLVQITGRELARSTCVLACAFFAGQRNCRLNGQARTLVLRHSVLTCDALSGKSVVRMDKCQLLS